MRIATFNLRAGGSGQHWTSALDETKADLLFVQEAKNPALYPLDLFDPRDLARAHWAGVPHGLWGSALLMRDAAVEPVVVPEFAGWVVGGVLAVGKTRVHAFSVHMPTAKQSYVTLANRLIDALKPIVREGALILGGDWNLTVGLRQPTEEMKNTPGEIRLLHRLEQELGLIPAWSTFHRGAPLPQTLRWVKDPVPPFHCDGIFLPSAWADTIRSAEVLTGEPWEGLSDHNPVVVEWGEEREPTW